MGGVDRSSVASGNGAPPKKPERISAIFVAALAIGFSTWVMLTLPIQGAFILTMASVVSWIAWVRTTYAYPVQSRRVVAVYLCAPLVPARSPDPPVPPDEVARPEAALVGGDRRARADVGLGVTVAPLVCEDLARLDEVADLVRIGPSLVVALLLDGPQLASRWPCRYASILVDEPGSAVLTLTSSGMAARSRPPGKPRSRVIAHWNNGPDGLHELELQPGAVALLLSASVDSRTLWTADGRRHLGVPGLTLAGVHQLHGGNAASRRRTRARRTRPAPV